VADKFSTNPETAVALSSGDVRGDGVRDARRFTATRRVLAGSLLVWSLILTSAAAKDFTPGVLSVCNASRCVSIRSQSVLNALASFYYDSARPPARARAPRLDVPFFRLEFSDGYVTGIVAGSGLNRFLSYGVNLNQFRDGVWYRIPAGAVAGLRLLTVGLTPLRLTGAALAAIPTFGVQPRGATQPRPPGRGSTTAGGHSGSLSWLLGLVPLAALVALTLVARRRRRSVASRRPTLRVR
jgi:hypothetical protein